MSQNRQTVSKRIALLLLCCGTVWAEEMVPPPAFDEMPLHNQSEKYDSHLMAMSEGHGAVSGEMGHEFHEPTHTVVTPQPPMEAYHSSVEPVSMGQATAPQALPVGHSISSGINFEKDPHQQDDEDNVVDTVKSESGGNWLLKRVWWEKTEDIYAQIKDTFNKVMTSRMTFFSLRSKLDKSLDQFYQNIGLEQGPLQDILHFALEVIEKEKAHNGELTKKEQALLDKIQDKQRTLEQLKKDVDAIEALDVKVDEALSVVLQQINICNKYEQQAWENFKNIARELNDKEARKQYYDTKGLFDDIEKINTYLTGAFSQYFNQTIQSAHDHMKSIAAQMSALKNDGVDLKKEADALEKEDSDVVQEQKIEKKETEPQEKQGIWKRVVIFFSAIITTIKEWSYNLSSKLWGFFSKNMHSGVVVLPKVKDVASSKENLEVHVGEGGVALHTEEDEHSVDEPSIEIGKHIQKEHIEDATHDLSNNHDTEEEIFEKSFDKHIDLEKEYDNESIE